jgi:hypothetical protein
VKMKSRTFNVPEELIIEFAQVLEKYDLPNSIEGTTEDGEVVIEVDYEEKQRKIIHQLNDLIDDFNEEDEDEEEEDDTDEEDE